MFLGKKLQKINSKTFHRKLKNFEKIHEMLGFYGEFPAIHPVVKFRGFLVKILQKTTPKTFHRTLRNFKKIPEMLGFDGEFPPVHPIAKY